MIKAHIIDLLTELYADGGGYLTQSYPTQYRQFWTTKMLTPKDSADNYREADAAEKAAWDAAHPDGWAPELPSAEFRAHANQLGIKFNDSTAYFEYNTLTDLITEDVRRIIAAGSLSFPYPQAYSSDSKMRTNLCLSNSTSGMFDRHPNMDGVFRGCKFLEVAYLGAAPASFPLTPASVQRLFQNCNKLRSVIGIIGCAAISSFFMSFYDCPLLETIKLNGIKCSVSFADSPRLSLESLRYLVDNAANGETTITVTVHKLPFAKLNGARILCNSFRTTAWDVYASGDGVAHGFNFTPAEMLFTPEQGDHVIVKGTDSAGNLRYAFGRVYGVVETGEKINVAVFSDGGGIGELDFDAEEWSQLKADAAEKNISFAKP